MSICIYMYIFATIIIQEHSINFGEGSSEAIGREDEWKDSMHICKVLKWIKLKITYIKTYNIILK